MKEIVLKFQGYTWDEYFYVIANKPGILVAYKGGLDSEGAVKLDDIIYVDEADELGRIYECDGLSGLKKQINTNNRLFYSYAEMQYEGRVEVTHILKNVLLNENNNNHKAKVNITCEGACALFPKEILKEK